LKYREFGKTGWKSSVLGFGAMRLPTIGGDPSKIDEPLAIEMIRYAVDHGVNYVDTAWPYHGGRSEVVVGKALEEGYREKARLATKMPTWLVEEEGDFDRFLGEQLKRLGVDKIDFYLLHGLNKSRWPKLKELGVFDWAEGTLEEGRIGHLGFSFHDEYNVFEDILRDSDRFAFCQIQLNYVDSDYQAGVRGMRLAHGKGLAVVVMEPIKGGKLALPPPREVGEIWARAPVRRPLAEWALQWVWNHPEVSVALSGMSNMRHVVENLEYADRSGAGSLSEEELALIEEVREAYSRAGFVGCTGCRYCMPCPSGVAIPEVLELYNEYFMSGRSEAVKEKYWEVVSEEENARHCVACGACEEKCPQGLPIRRLMSEASRIFARRG